MDTQVDDVQSPNLAKRFKEKLLLPTLTGLIIIAIFTFTYIFVQNQQKIANNSSPEPTITTTPTPTSSPSATPSPTATPTPASSPTPTLVATPTKAPVSPTHMSLQPEIVYGNQSTKQVVFTFDAGSGNKSINQILSTLANFKVEGSFFITGAWADKYPNDLKRIAQNGHAIYNHTYNHPHLVQMSDAQIKDELHKTDAKIKSIVGFDTKPYFRAPYGERDARVLSIAASQGYRHVYWTIDAWDWKEDITANEVRSRILDNLEPGAIYLMHVGDSITGEILSGVFQEIKNRGYTINSLNTGL